MTAPYTDSKTQRLFGGRTEAIDLRPSGVVASTLSDGIVGFLEVPLSEAASVLTGGDVQKFVDEFISSGRIRLSPRRPGMPKTAPRAAMKDDVMAVLSGQR